jgi:hypothetical protein
LALGVLAGWHDVGGAVGDRLPPNEVIVARP